MGDWHFVQQLEFGMVWRLAEWNSPGIKGLDCQTLWAALFGFSAEFVFLKKNDFFVVVVYSAKESFFFRFQLCVRSGQGSDR